MADHKINHHLKFDLRNLSSMRQNGQGVRTASERRQTPSSRMTRQSHNNYHQRQSRRPFDRHEEDAINVDDLSSYSDSGREGRNMSKDSGCTNCISVFNILLGLAIASLWGYCYFSCYTGKVLLINFAAGAWAGGLVVISGICTFVYSCIWNNCMGICALSFNIFVIASTLACAGISGMDAFIEYRIYKDENYVPPSINVSYIIDALKESLDKGDINEKTTEEDFAYDGAIIYGLITLCCLLVTILTVAWSCYFCVAEDDEDDGDDDDESDEDEYTNKHRDNVSVRSPFATTTVPRGQIAEDYEWGRHGYNSHMNAGHQPSRQYHPQERLNWGYYDDDYSLQPSRNVAAYVNGRYQPPLYEEHDPPIAMSDRGRGNREQHMNAGRQSQYHQRGPPPPRQKPRNKRNGTSVSNTDNIRQAGIPRASSRYYAESLPEHRPFGRNQYSQGQRAYSIDDLAYNGRQRENEQLSRMEVNPDRSWMYNYY